MIMLTGSPNSTLFRPPHTHTQQTHKHKHTHTYITTYKQQLNPVARRLTIQVKHKEERRGKARNLEVVDSIDAH